MSALRLGELAARPVLTMPEDSTLTQARALMARSGVQALVVVDHMDRFLGVLEGKVLEKALAYGLEKRVGELADPEAPALDKETLVEEKVLAKALYSPCSLAVALEGQSPWGVLTAREIHAAGIELPKAPKIFLEDMPPKLRELFLEIATLANTLGTRVFLVGGGVRDLIWGKEAFDLDLVATSQVEELACKIAKHFKGQIKARSPFGTLKLSLPEGLVLDLAQSRWEYYQAPAELPTVFPGPLYLDLWRRDFTINALALALNGPLAGQVLNWLGGVGDLEARCLRVHHPLSFVDDPTRIFRAARYLIRFALRPGACFRRSLSLALDLDVLSRLSPARIRGELERILEEPDPVAVLQYLIGLRVFDVLCTGEAQKGAPFLEGLFSLAREVSAEPKSLLKALALLFSEAGPGWKRLFDFPPGEAESLVQSLEKALTKAQSLSDLRPSARVKFLEGLPLAVLLALGARLPMVRGIISEYLLKLRHVRPALSGKDLKALGVPPGPEMGRILRRLREARLDGEVKSPEEEQALVKKEFAHVFS